MFWMIIFFHSIYIRLDNSSSTAMPKESEIDESLYSRQLYVMGHEAQKRVASSSVLIAGMNGLGIETAKNVTLMGVKKLTIYDDKVATWADLSSQFYLTEADLGKSRAVPSAAKLAELNPYVDVSYTEGDLFEIIRTGSFHVVVLVDQSFDKQTSISEYCHANNIAFIIGDARGVFGEIFCDFGDSFVVSDTNGEPNASSMVAGITSDVRGLVTTLEETRHGLSTGDAVILSDIVGMTELNGRTFTVEVKDPFSFEIDCDTRGFGAYTNGGYVNQVKQPTTISFKPFTASIRQPDEFVCDAAKFDNAFVLHFAFQALHHFQQAHGHLPTPGSIAHADEIYATVLDLNATIPSDSGAFKLDARDIEAKEKFIKRFAMTAQGMISPICAFLGGVLGQEVLKAVSGKFMPIKQWFYFDAIEALSEDALSEEAVRPVGCRYDGQIMVFGQELQQRIQSLRMFLVGAGAIGCEMLKNWAMMGVACGSSGIVHVTDMDQIEKSNLSRQFLFRNTDINRPKSTTAIRAVRDMNAAFQGQAHEMKVAPETESFFNDDFYESLDFVCTALDNVDARLYVDAKCLFYRKPMMESGTLGAKGHTQIVSPGQTEHYGARRDPAEKSIPVCTLKHFPNQIEHTLQWARDWFEEGFKQAAEDVNNYLDKADFFNQLENQQNTRLETLKRLKTSLVDARPTSYPDCLSYARRAFEDLFSNQIQQLLSTFPADHITNAGTPFWSGAKKPPSPLKFDANDPAHVGFVSSVAQLRAHVYNLAVPNEAEDPVYVQNILAGVTVEPFRPQAGVKIAATDEELKQEAESKRAAAGAESSSELERLCQSLIAALPPREELQKENFRLRAVDFDKDIDAHMLVVAATSNLRARNYRIPEADLHTSRGIAGKIIPAIATTTAMVTGAICLELYKVLQQKPREQLFNFFANLAVPIFTSENAEPPKSTKAIIKGREWLWTQWDRIDVHGPGLTVQQLIDWLLDEYGLELSMLSSGVTILFSDFMDPKKRKERISMPLEKLVQTVTKKVSFMPEVVTTLANA